MAFQPLTVTTVTKVYVLKSGELELFIQHGKKKSIPARLAMMTPNTDYLPKIGDEVVVGFINETPLEAVVLGILRKKKQPAPLVKNDEQSIVSKSGLKIHFDDTSKSISIETPAGNSIVLNESDKSISIEDQNKNSIQMDSSGISLKSPKDINIEAGGKINIKAKQNLNVEGLNVDCKSKAQLNLAGGAGAKLNSSAIVEVKGSLVKIN